MQTSNGQLQAKPAGAETARDALPDRVAVIGLGLIGGSLARDLSERGVEVIGYDRDAATLATAQAAGVVGRALAPDLAGVERAGLVVVAVPAAAVAAVLAALAPRLAPGCVVTDVTSTKRAVVAAAAEAGLAERFVGSHPLAGDHRCGWRAARTGLFAERPVFLTPAERTAPAATALVDAFWRALGARPEAVDAEAHDRRLAWVSHLPQVTSSALAHVLAAARLSPADLGAGGRDTTRLAASSAEVWTSICLQNRDHLGHALAGLVEQLGELHAALAESDAERLHRFFAGAQRWSAGSACAEPAATARG
jgi:prephenate dehydrogenase